MYKKRLIAYILDTFAIALGSFIASIGTMGLIGILALFMLPFFEETSLNKILIIVFNLMIIPFFIISTISTVGINYKFSKTIGYKIVGLEVKGNKWYKLFIRWFMRTGVISIFFYSYCWILMNEFDYTGSFFKLAWLTYIIYMVVDNLFVFFTKEKKTLTDSLLKIDIYNFDNKKVSK